MSGQGDDARLAAIAAELEAVAHAADPVARIHALDDERLSRFYLLANRAGFLRLAAALVRGASSPVQDGPEMPADDPGEASAIGGLFDARSDHDLVALVRREDLARQAPPPPRARSIGDRLIPGALLLGCLGTIALVVIGFGTVVGWIGR